MRARLALAAFTLLCLAAVPAPLRVGTSGDYAPFSIVAAYGARSGFDVDVAGKLAESLGRKLEFVPFRWPELLELAQQGSFDLVASGVTIRPDRVVNGRFTRPYAVSEAVVLIRRGEADRFRTLADLDRKENRIAVNAGGYLESVARATFKQARVQPVTDNRTLTVPVATMHAEALVTDSMEQQQLPGPDRFVRLAALTRDRKALWVPNELADGGDARALNAAADAWLAAHNSEVDTLRLEWLGSGATMSNQAARLQAIVALVDERNGIAPWIAAAKRAKNLPVVDPEREKKVLATAAERARAAGLPEGAVVNLAAVLIETSKDIQRATGPVEPPVELGTLRDILNELDDRLVAELAAAPGLDAASLRSELDAMPWPGVPQERKQQLADALALGSGIGGRGSRKK